MVPQPTSNLLFTANVSFMLLLLSSFQDTVNEPFVVSPYCPIVVVVAVLVIISWWHFHEPSCGGLLWKRRFLQRVVSSALLAPNSLWRRAKGFVVVVVAHFEHQAKRGVSALLCGQGRSGSSGPFANKKTDGFRRDLFVDLRASFAGDVHHERVLGP